LDGVRPLALVLAWMLIPLFGPGRDSPGPERRRVLATERSSFVQKEPATSRRDDMRSSGYRSYGGRSCQIF